jgi:enoyl-CoA hydratase/carnithine racemase
VALDQRTPRLDFDGPVCTICLDRADKRNALNIATWRSIPDLIGKAVAHAPARVILLRGAEGHFAAGADIAEFDTVFADRAATLSYLADMTAATTSIAASPVPVIAVIEGLCIGAGVALAAACDLRLASSNAQFAITPAKLGLIYSRLDTRRVIDLIGVSAAKELLFTGRTIDAGVARSIGLVDEVVDPQKLDLAASEKAMMIAATSAWTHSHSKIIVASIMDGIRDDDDQTRGWFADAPEGADYREGVAAFRARRTPSFCSR